MFESSTSVSTNIAIYPNASDDWTVSSPFTGELLSGPEIGFVLSDALVNNDGSLHLLPKRLLSVSRPKNSIDFLTKTNLQQKTVPTSKGIGGMSKLKDFNFTITKDYIGINPLSMANIFGLYGRAATVYISDSTAVEDPTDGAKSKITFAGRIFSSDRIDNGIVFTVRGKLNTANPLVGGPIVTQSDGSQTNEAIVFGDSGDLYVPISKKESDDGNLTLQFSQSDNFIIKSFHVKGGTDDEPIWLDVTTPYDIVDNEIIFNPTEYTSVKTTSSIPLGESISRISVENYFQIAFKLERMDDPDPHDLVEGDICHFFPYKFQNKLIFIKQEVISGEDIYFFKCGWELVHGWQNSNFSLVYFTAPDLNSTFWITSPATTNKLAPIEKEVDLLDKKYSPSDEEYSEAELKDELSQWNTEDRVFQKIPKDPLIIQVENEKMLVIYTEKNTGYPSYETRPDSPVDAYMWVVRGWAGTTVSSHLTDVPIEVVTDVKQKIIVTFKQKLKNLTTVTPSKDWVFNDIIQYIHYNNGDLKVDVANSVSDPVGFIGLDWNLPEISGDIYKIYMEGTATALDHPLNYYSSTVDRDCFINLALHTIAEGTETGDELKEKNRRAVGVLQRSDVHEEDVYKIASYHWDSVGGERVIGGAYRFEVKDSYSYARLDADTNLVKRGYKSRTRSYSIDSYSDLRTTSMFVCFNGMNLKTKKSKFTFGLPTLEVQLKMSLGDSDIYAKVIPKSIFDTPQDTLAIGTNCKIAWHPYDFYNPTGEPDLANPPKNLFAISDDDVIGFSAAGVSPTQTFSVPPVNPNADAEGFLVKDLIRGNAIGKFYPTANEKEDYIPPVGADDFDRITGYDSGLLDAGGIFLENDTTYIWVDQVNNLIKSALKTTVNDGNPVSIIKTILETYFDDVTLDTTAFDKATEQRLSWDARLLVTEERTLIDIVDTVAKEHGLIVYENNVGEMSVVALDPPTEDSVTDDIDDSMIRFKSHDKASLLDFKETFTEMDYIISEMDVYYNFISGKYQGYIKSDSLSDQDSFITAAMYVENDIKVKLQLQSIYNSETANLSAAIKMLYHSAPTRIFTIRTTLATVDYEIGKWVTCSASGLTELTDKIYLIMDKEEGLPMSGNTDVKLLMFEYDWGAIQKNIHEVPAQTINDNYDEVITTTDQIQEVLDG